MLPSAMLHETARPYLHVTKVSYGFVKNAHLGCGILNPEAGSHFDAVFTTGIAGPEFKTYRILRGVRGELGCSSQELQGEMLTNHTLS